MESLAPPATMIRRLPAGMQRDEGPKRWLGGLFGVTRDYCWWWAIAAAVVVPYGLVTQFVRVPNCDAHPALAPNCNLAAYIDTLVLGTKHMYSAPLCKRMRNGCAAFDPEGLFTTLGAVGSGFIGVSTDQS